MTLPTLQTLGTVKYGSTILYCTDIDVNENPTVTPILGEGILTPTGQIILKAQPQATFTCIDLLTVLTDLSLQANSLTSDNVVIYKRTVTNESIAGTSNGTSYALDQGILVINNIRLVQGGIGVATGTIYFDSTDGVTGWTVSEGSASLPSLAALTNILTLAPITLNGTSLIGTVAVDINLNNTINPVWCDGGLLPVSSWLSGHNPSFTFTSINPGQMRTLIGQGLNLASGGLVIPTYATTGGVITSPSTPSDGTMTIHVGMATCANRPSTQHGDDKITWNVAGAYNLTNAPIVIS